jgi:Ala-tRNA(Pro) deacylase
MQDIKKYLNNLEIQFRTHNHPPLYTCVQAEQYNKDIKGIHSKNLFMKSKKSKDNFYLIIIPAKERLEIKRFEQLLNEKLSFANDKELKDILNLTPGAVTPFSLINDNESKVNIIISKEVWESDLVSFHPNINTQTLELKGEDFHKYINSLKNKLIII